MSRRPHWRLPPEIPDIEITSVESIPHPFIVEGLILQLIDQRLEDLSSWKITFGIEAINPAHFDPKGPYEVTGNGQGSQGVQYAEYLMRTENVFMRCWQDGKLAVGMFPVERGDETLYLGLAKLDRSLSLLDGRQA
ncbi:hypothetical protein C1H76_1335 [Elsinoe australis]|uniref:Uncharacterized protein n=1 Tax=Elsinoe australis TaxID=40998 RepID=A0A4U7B4T3_9PEZI|nr:hypothetical protein C1H76_1335 [Elsinoe australis]